MGFKFKSFLSAVAVMLTFATISISTFAECENGISSTINDTLEGDSTVGGEHTDVEYENDILSIGNEILEENSIVGEEHTDAEYEEEHADKYTLNNENQDVGCLHSVLYTFDNTTMTIDDVYEENAVSALLDDVLYYSDEHYAVILKDGIEIYDGFLEEGMIVQIYHSDDLYGEYTIGKLLEPVNFMLTSDDDYVKPLDDLNTSQHLTCQFNCEKDGQLCDWCLKNEPYFVNRIHDGQDISWSTIDGKTIRAMSGGTVINKVNTSSSTSWGSYVKIDHGNGLQTLYAHMQYNSPNVNVNQKISKGTAIGKVGNTGLSTSPHLHITVYLNGVAVNPKPYLDKATTFTAPKNDYRIIDGPLTIRSNPSTTATSYGTLSNGTSVSISNIEIGNGTYVFGKISSGTYQGRWIAIGTTTGEMYAVNMSDVWYVFDGPLNVRSTSSTSASSYGTIANGSSFKLTDVIISGNYVMGQIASSPNPILSSGSTCSVSNAKGHWIAINYCAPYID